MRIKRTSDVIETISERAIYFIFGGLLCAGGAFIFFRYKGDGMFTGLAWVLALAAAGLIAFGIKVALGTRKVEVYTVDCPICTERNELTAQPVDEDVTCVACNHLIPIKGGAVLPVQQVRCGFCNSLNYYSEKTELLICETCNHEIPITQEEGKPTKVLPKGFAVVDDNQAYELVLVDGGKKDEEVIKTLQTMLALNRNQVKDMLEELPVTLLQGIPRMKAEMLSAQLATHGAKAEMRVVSQ